MRAHDGVADHQSKPSNLGDEDFIEDPISNYGEDTIKIIHLEKTNEPLVSQTMSRVLCYVSLPSESSPHPTQLKLQSYRSK